MKTLKTLLAGTALAAASLAAGSAFAQAEDPGWPRVSGDGTSELRVYQPQIDSWTDYSTLHFRCAISVKTPRFSEPVLGVAEVDARTAVDRVIRTVALIPTKRELRFAGRSEDDAAFLRATVDALKPTDQAISISLDRVLACLNPQEQQRQKAVAVSMDPPRVFTSDKPALLVMFLGEPRFKPVVKGRMDLLFALNTNWDLFLDTQSQCYFLLYQGAWLTAPAVGGPWAAAVRLPDSLSSLPDDDNWQQVRQNIPGKLGAAAPAVFVSNQPAELIVTDGDPDFTPIPGTRLMRVANTDSVLFMCSADSQYYLLSAGRWFRAGALTGPWTASSRTLPADFARIPADDPSAFVRASVAGTREAQDAVLLASVPTTSSVPLVAPAAQVTYSGTPQFKPVEGAAVQSAANSPDSVFAVNGSYYWCAQGAWFESSAATGPWATCAKVPDAIYAIPSSSPLHNVTYVKVQSVTQTNVVYCQTAGYSGEYVDDSGVVVFGSGLIAGTLLAEDSDAFYYPYPPYYYSYGCGAVYHYGYGGYCTRANWAYGPYGGVGYGTAYNPVTGTYARGATAYGPYGSAGVRQAYNPYTGAYAQGGRVSTAYGSASRFSATRNGEAVWGGTRSGYHGSAGAVRTSEGAGVAAWSTAEGRSAVGRSQDGDYYAAHDGTVYKREGQGDWSKNTGSGWQGVSRPASPQVSNLNAPRSFASGGGESWQGLESHYQARSWGGQQAAVAQSWRSSGGNWGGGRSVGGRGRR